MDVGLNNKNMWSDNKDLKDVEFLIEATDAEQFELWKQYDKNHYDIDDLDKEIIVPDITQYSMFNNEFNKHLSIKNQLEIERIKYLIESVITRNEKIRRHREHMIDWKSLSYGISVTIGTNNGNPVSINFTFVNLNGHKVAFYESASWVTDYRMVRHYLITHFQRTNDKYTRWNHTNAMNFHNCVNALDDIDKEPRETIYDGDDLMDKKTIKKNKIVWAF